VAVIWVELTTLTEVAGSITLSEDGAPADSSTKLTVEPLTKPDPPIVIGVPPAMLPVGLPPVEVRTIEVNVGSWGE
jgi:hypothetical protein